MLDELNDVEIPNNALFLGDDKELKEAIKNMEDDTATDSTKLFDAVNQILKGKTHIDLEAEQEHKNWYSQMFVNNALSQYIDTVLFAYEMNKAHGISDQAHFDYLFYAVKSANRPRVKWAKLEGGAEDKLLVAIFATTNQINREKAREYISKLPEAKLTAFKQRVKPMALDRLDNVLSAYTMKDRKAIRNLVDKTW